MQSKQVFLLSFMVAMLGLGPAFAQSSHDAPAATDLSGNRFHFGTPDGRYTLRVTGLLQENNAFVYRAGGNKDFKIDLTRARIGMDDTVVDQRLTYQLQLAFEKDQERGDRLDGRYVAPGSQFLKDYNVNWAIDRSHLHLKIGKFTAPFSRQSLANASQSQFGQISAAAEAFQLTTSGSDVGVMLHNGQNNQIDYAVAALSHGLVGRVGYNYKDVDGYNLVDFAGGDLRFGVAASGFFHTSYNEAKVDDFRGQADFIVKLNGLSTNGAFYYQYFKRDENAEGKNRLGLGLDAGYLLKKRFEPVIRYSLLRANEMNGHDLVGGVNYYVYGHNLKLNGYGGLNFLDSNFVRWQLGVQVQFAI